MVGLQPTWLERSIRTASVATRRSLAVAAPANSLVARERQPVDRSNLLVVFDGLSMNTLVEDHAHRSLGQCPRCARRRDVVWPKAIVTRCSECVYGFQPKMGRRSWFLGRCPRLRCGWPSANVAREIDSDSIRGHTSFVSSGRGSQFFGITRTSTRRPLEPARSA